MLSKRKLYVQTRTGKQKEAVAEFASQMSLDVVFCEPVSYEDIFSCLPLAGGVRRSREGVVLSNSIHIFNHSSILALQELGLDSFAFIGSYELTKHEWRELCSAIADPGIIPVLPVYGRVPLMESANCVKKTSGACDGVKGFTEIIDRKNVHFPVFCECDHAPHCRNIIYNSVPTSLAGLYESDWKGAVYFNFTTELQDEIREILRAFCDGKNPPDLKFTRGHYKKSVL